jgi:hypothetical protein
VPSVYIWQYHLVNGAIELLHIESTGIEIR